MSSLRRQRREILQNLSSILQLLEHFVQGLNALRVSSKLTHGDMRSLYEKLSIAVQKLLQ